MTMQKINDKLYNWASILEPKTLGQAVMTSRMPFICPHVALMPDAHLGKGATIGSVIPTVGAIMPAAVGGDTGCGMVAVRTQWSRAEFTEYGDADLRYLREMIEKRIPLSAGNYNREVYASHTRRRIEELEAMAGIESAQAAAPNWHLQLGTLGSGNHFIEISRDEEDRVWLFLHSGSRGVGNKLANMHIRKAVEWCRDRRVALPDRDLAYLEEGTKEFDAYIRDLRWAQHFALLNRAEMMDRVTEAVEKWIGQRVVTGESVNCHHNYTEEITTFGKRRFWLSRKGAIDATEGRMGLIPGSMGTASYVVAGKGSKMALNSAPHGAGRNFSRGDARRAFTMTDLEQRMAGIEWSHRDAFLDEHPLAYKPIGQVMEDAADLVKIVHTLNQFMNVKGD